MRCFIIYISDGDKHFSEPIKEYEKRLGKFVKLIKIKPSKGRPTKQIKTIETQKMLDALAKESYDIAYALTEYGNTYDSHTFAKIFDNGKNVGFLVGGAFGFDSELLSQSGLSEIAFGSQTMPHALARLALLEQVWRARTIHEGRTYHY